MAKHLLGALSLVALATGCDSDAAGPGTGSETPNKVAAVVVGPPNVTTCTSVPRTLIATASDALNRPIPTPAESFTWVGSDPDVAIVESTGRVVPVGRGTLSVTASIDGFSGSTEVSVLEAQRGSSGEVFWIDFEQTPLGPYTDADVRNDWPNVTSTVNLEAGLAEIVDGAEAYGQRSLRVTVPPGSLPPAPKWVVQFAQMDSAYYAIRVRFESAFAGAHQGPLGQLIGGTEEGDPDGTNWWMARPTFATLAGPSGDTVFAFHNVAYAGGTDTGPSGGHMGSVHGRGSTGGGRPYDRVADSATPCFKLELGLPQTGIDPHRPSVRMPFRPASHRGTYHKIGNKWHEKGPSRRRGHTRKALRLPECRRRDLNPRHADYDSAALTN
jgi:hypothetical protein